MKNFFLTIAASDNSGGAGIQQDCRVANEWNLWPLSVITAITIQNFEKLYRIHYLPSELVRETLLSTITEFPVKVVKIGALGSKDVAEEIASILEHYNLPLIVWDPVFYASDGSLISEICNDFDVIEKYLKIAHIVTPNKNELEILLQSSVSNFEQAIEKAKILSKKYDIIVLLKGGHFLSEQLVEAIVGKDFQQIFTRKRLNFNYQHGTGCTFSSAFACAYNLYNDLFRAYISAINFVEKFYSDVNFVKI